MALKAILTEKPSEELSDYYKEVESEGDSKTWVLDVEPVNGFALEDVAGLKRTLSDRTEKHKKASRKLEALQEALGEDEVDPEKIQALQQELKTLREGSNDEKFKSQLEQREKQLLEKHEKEVETLKGRNKQLWDHFTRVARDERARAALQKRIKDSAAVDILLPHVLGKLDVREEDGKPQTVVLGEDGNPRMTMQTGKHDPMSVDELVELMSKEDRYARLFDSSGAAGSGSGGSTGGAGRETGSQLILSRDQARDTRQYRAARERAQKEGKQLVIQD